MKVTVLPHYSPILLFSHYFGETLLLDGKIIDM